MIQVIGQAVEAGNENGARQLFDVLETLLILVSQNVERSQDYSHQCRKYPFSGGISRNWFNFFFNVVLIVVSMANFAFLRLMPSTGLSNSECQVITIPYFTPLTHFRFSKKSKIQSHSIAPAILEGLMPITTEEEPDDVDDDAPSRVRICPCLFFRTMLTSFSSA